jgi:hypothetical protein
MNARQPLRSIWADEPRRYLLLLVLFAAVFSYAFVGSPGPVRPLEVGIAAGGGIMLPLFGLVSTSQTHPAMLAAMAGLGQAAGPCAGGLLVFWAAMGLVSGRSRAIQFTGIAFGAASAGTGLLFLLKWVDPYPLIWGWRAAGIALGAFALFWGLHELDGIVRARRSKKKKNEKAVSSFGPLFFAGVVAAGLVAIPITAAVFVCAGPLNAGIIGATAQAPEQAAYLAVYAFVYAVAPLIIFALVYLAAFGRFGRRVELGARLLGILLLLLFGAAMLLLPVV